MYQMFFDARKNCLASFQQSVMVLLANVAGMQKRCRQLFRKLLSSEQCLKPLNILYLMYNIKSQQMQYLTPTVKSIVIKTCHWLPVEGQQEVG